MVRFSVDDRRLVHIHTQFDDCCSCLLRRPILGTKLSKLTPRLDLTAEKICTKINSIGHFFEASLGLRQTGGSRF